jgi:hypothetical protein
MTSLKAFFDFFGRLSGRAWLGIVLAVALGERAGLRLLYAAIPYNDTPSYWRLARSVARGFYRYDGTRTPGYPLFLAVVGSDEAAWLVQMALGVAVTLLFFYIGWQLSGRAWFGGLAALAHTLSLQQLFFEPNLLSETPTTFWVVLALAGVTAWYCQPRLRSLWLAAGLALVVSLAWLTRPLFIYLPFWVLFFFIIVGIKISPQSAQSPQRFKKEFSSVISVRSVVDDFWGKFKLFISSFPPFTLFGIAVFALITMLAFGAWVGFIHERFRQWSLTTMTGYHMIQHTGVFFEYVPDDYAALRDTYLKYRDAHIAQYGTQANTIWEAIPEMQKVSKRSFYNLSRLLAKISIQLVLEHPDLYLKNVLLGWAWFWKAPTYWSPDSIRWPGLAPVLGGLIFAQRLLLLGCNLVFILTTIAAAILKKARAAWKLNPILWHIAGSVWIASVLQTLMDHGDNVRFLVPLQSMVIVWVLWVGWRLLSRPPKSFVI